MMVGSQFQPQAAYPQGLNPKYPLNGMDGFQGWCRQDGKRKFLSPMGIFLVMQAVANYYTDRANGLIYLHFITIFQFNFLQSHYVHLFMMLKKSVHFSCMRVSVVLLFSQACWV
jgi:hypothetical protein